MTCIKDDLERGVQILREETTSKDHLLKEACSCLNQTRQQNKALTAVKNKLHMRDAQASGRVITAVKRAVRVKEKADAAKSIVQLKPKGIYDEKTRSAVRELVSKCGVPVAKVGEAFQVVAESMDIPVKDKISSRTASRVMLEGRVGAKIQIVHNILEAKSKTRPIIFIGKANIRLAGYTISSDGTSHKHHNFESSHILMKSNLSTSTSTAVSEPSRFFLGIQSAINHTSESQLQGWKETLLDLYTTYNASPQGAEKPASLMEFTARMTGLNTDHAEDQKKLFCLMREWKLSCDWEVRGVAAMSAAVPSELISVLMEENEMKLAAAGGIVGWDGLSMEDQDARDREVCQAITIRFGKQVYDQLDADAKRQVDLFIWAGCCMHKEMNSVKGGNAAMMAYWSKHNLKGPICLMNRNNAAAAAAGPSAAQEQAEEVSQCGAVKAASLAGGIFNHKDDKKGQHETLQIYLESKLRMRIRFPDTSNNRYQSHCEAAAVLVVHLQTYIDFLIFVHDKKEARTFMNMEQNVLNALNDILTITELCVLVLYLLSISYPYMRVIWGPGKQNINVLDLGLLHEWVQTHCQNIINNSNLLLSPEASHETGSMDGLIWERPEAFYVIQSMAADLPHLHGATIAFFEGALQTWGRFSAEYQSGGMIASLSSAEKALAHMETTNDPNEGALGSFRVKSRDAPSMGLDQGNARSMYN